jgi:hypothetical protein
MLKKDFNKRPVPYPVICVFVFNAGSASGNIGLAENDSGVVVKSECIYNKREVPYPSCHASTLAETPDEPVVADPGKINAKQLLTSCGLYK